MAMDARHMDVLRNLGCSGESMNSEHVPSDYVSSRIYPKSQSPEVPANAKTTVGHGTNPHVLLCGNGNGGDRQKLEKKPRR